MAYSGSAIRIRIYIGEDHRHHGRALYLALLEHLRGHGAMGATVTRGIAGFGAHSRIHTASVLSLSVDLPLVVEWVDTPEQVARLLPELQSMIGGGMITSEEVHIVQYPSISKPSE